MKFPQIPLELRQKAVLIQQLYSSLPLTVMCPALTCNNHIQVTVANVTQPMAIAWL